MRGGYFPAPPEAVALAATLVRPPCNSPFSLLDPCAGQGDAIRQLGDLLACPPSQIHAIELDDSRAIQLRTTLPEAKVLAPASFFGCRATFNSFSMIWLNPPFDADYAGSRVESAFLRRATQWLLPGGVMALVCPEDVADEYSDVRSHFASYYENCMIVPFPDGLRRFREVIVLGQKRARPQADERRRDAWAEVQASAGFIYNIPAGTGPKVFEKVEPTEPELKEMLARSPLRCHLTTPPQTPVPSPPLALGIGHVALLLASGHLDGLVHPEGQSPHVVRGTSRKREVVSDVTESTNPDGSTSTKTTISERIELVVRTVDGSGQLRTFMDSDAGEG